MSGKEFLSKCTAQGGNWTAMLMSGIKECFPDYWNKLDPDKEYYMRDVWKMTEECGVIWEED